VIGRLRRDRNSSYKLVRPGRRPRTGDRWGANRSRWSWACCGGHGRVTEAQTAHARQDRLRGVDLPARHPRDAVGSREALVLPMHVGLHQAATLTSCERKPPHRDRTNHGDDVSSRLTGPTGKQPRTPAAALAALGKRVRRHTGSASMRVGRQISRRRPSEGSHFEAGRHPGW
jgi:hypothetical protein